VPAHERIYKQSTPHRPSERAKHEEGSNPVGNSPVRDNQASVARNTGRYDAVLMRKRVSRSRLFDGADLEKGIIAGGPNGYNAPVCDGFEGVSIGSRGIALFIVELQRTLVRGQTAVEPSSGLGESIPILPSQRIVDQLHTNLSLDMIVVSRSRGIWATANPQMACPRPVRLRSAQRLLSLRTGAWCILGTLGCAINQRKEPPHAMHLSPPLGMRHQSAVQSHWRRAGSPSCKALTVCLLNDRRMHVSQGELHGCAALAATAKPIWQSAHADDFLDCQCPRLVRHGGLLSVCKTSQCTLPGKLLARLGVSLSKRPIGAACVHIAGSHQLSIRPTQRSPDNAVSLPLCAITKCREGRTGFSP
jgi:hypothetical protein